MLFSEPVGFVGERKALALLSLAFYMAFYGLMSLLMANAPPDHPELRAFWPCFAALCACYGLGFFALAAEWFWARWFAIGLGYSGLTMAGWGIVMSRSIEPVLVFYGLTHGLIALLLQGERMAACFDAKPGWRERLNLDEAAAVRVRQTVTRAAAGLPTLIMFALAPRETAMALLTLGAAILGLWGLIGLRTWGVLLLFGSGLLALWSAAHGHAPAFAELGPMRGLGWIAAAALLSATVPFYRPVARFLARR